MKKVILLIAVIALLVTGCDDAKYANRMDELKQNSCLPAEAKVLKEYASSDASHIWLVFTLGNDTLLYHRYKGGSDGRESMCKISFDGNVEAAADTTKTETEQ